MSAAQRNAIACTLCKARKVRCDRIIPKCGRCVSHDAECEYPERRKRAPVKTSKDRSAEINALLERLQRVESRVQANSPTQEALLPAHHSLQLPSPSSLPDAAKTGYDVPATPWHEVLEPKVDNDIYLRLKDAVDRIAKTKLGKTFHTAKSTQALSIPPDLAKSWIKNFFDLMPTFMILTLDENEHLLKLMPDLIGQEHVQVAPSIVVLYYIVLYHGCWLPSDRETCVPDQRTVVYMETTYILALRSLPAWQRSSTGSSVDLSAAIMMARAAAECYDFDFSHQMHKLACEYAEGLNIHMLDSETESPARSILRTDAERRRFWDLVQYDVFFRLLLNRPSALKTPMAVWKVNLPYFNTGLNVGTDTEPAIMFLFCAQITLELARFFELLDASEHEDKRALLPEVEIICQSMQGRFDGWQIDNVLNSTPITCVNGWLTADAALGCLMSIILMLRTVGVDDSPIVINTSRHVLQIVDNLLEQVPSITILSMSFFSLAAFMPYATLAEHASRQTSSSEESALDTTLLVRLKDVVSIVCKDDADFLPMMRAMRHACDQIHGRG